MSNALPDLTCPKCQSPMRQYERSGIVLDQCTQCQGIFLDRGELERLVQAEDQHYQSSQQPPAGYPGTNPTPRSGGFLSQILGGSGHQGGYRGGHH